MNMAVLTITGRRSRLELVFLFAIFLGVSYLIASLVDIFVDNVELLTWARLSVAVQCTIPGAVGLWGNLNKRDLLVRKTLYPVAFGYATVFSLYITALVNPNTDVPVFLVALALTVCCAAIGEIGYRISAFKSGDADRNMLDDFKQILETQMRREGELRDDHLTDDDRGV